jgi:hypothetical protein
MDVEFLKSAFEKGHYPPPERPEIADYICAGEQE